MTVTLVNYITYHLTTGEILSAGVCPEGSLADPDALSGRKLVQMSGVDPATQYIDVATGDPQDRPALGTSIDVQAIDADGVDEATVSSIPVGTIVYHSMVGEPEDSLTVNDGSFVFTTDEPGTYIIRLVKFPAQVEEYEIVAT